MNRTFFEPMESRLMLAAQLTAAQVTQIIDQAAAVSLPSQTIVVVDRTGDILGIFGQAPSGKNQKVSDTNTAALPGALSETTAQRYALVNAVAEARTAAFFESTQDAFTSRTARFIVQNDFPQPIVDTEAGPLLGVEFSNALGTDALQLGISTGLAAGLSGNPGGMPLFINGQPVGAIGVAGSGQVIAARQDLVPVPVPGVPMDQQSPAIQSDPTGAFYEGVEEYNFDEAVAQAGSQGFTAPSSIVATNILVNGLRLPYTAEGPATGAPPANVPGLTNNGQSLASLPTRTFFQYSPFGFTSPTVRAGLQSPYPTTTIPLISGGTIQVALDNNSPAAGGNPALNPSVTPGESMVPVIGPGGAIEWQPGNFGFVPGQAVDGTSVHLSKKDELQIVEQAVTEAESIRGAIRVPADVPAQVYVTVTDTQGDILTVESTPDATDFSFDVSVQKARTAAFFSSDTYAFTSRAIGFMADSLLPPSIENGVVGPLYELQESLALPQNQAMFLPQVVEPVNGVPTLVPNPLGNGITIFPGGAPLYKDGHLVGAVGISGDGVDQDDLIAFAGTNGFRPPASIEDDSLSSAQIVADITQKINELNYTAPAGTTLTSVNGTVNPHFTFPALNTLTSLFADPDVVTGNPDGITVTPSDTIIQRILKRLNAVGLDSVNLPYQKFPRNPDL
jgi:uncharacterized protein GlcG (DUF336 family)